MYLSSFDQKNAMQSKPFYEWSESDPLFENMTKNSVLLKIMSAKISKNMEADKNQYLSKYRDYNTTDQFLLEKPSSGLLLYDGTSIQWKK